MLRIIFTLFIGTLLKVPFLKLIGAGLLLWIAIKLILPEVEDPQYPGEHRGSLWAAARTIIVADAVMSLDNVIAIAAAAKGDWLLLVIGLLLSMPMIIFGSALLLRVMERFPILVTAGAGLLGWIAGELVLSDPLLEGLTAGDSGLIDEAVPALGRPWWSRQATSGQGCGGASRRFPSTPAPTELQLVLTPISGLATGC